MRPNPCLRLALAVALASPVAGCIELDPAAPPDPAAPVEIDEISVIAYVSHYKDPNLFAQISATPYPSALAGTAYIQLYASIDATSQFDRIAPEVNGSDARIPAGGIVVREVLDENMTPLRLTVMAKGPAGYNSHLGDWYFAVTNLQGVPQLKDGAPRSGRLVDCYGCHVPRAADDYLFGVPMADREPEAEAGSGTGS